MPQHQRVHVPIPLAVEKQRWNRFRTTLYSKDTFTEGVIPADRPRPAHPRR